MSADMQAEQAADKQAEQSAGKPAADKQAETLPVAADMETGPAAAGTAAEQAVRMQAGQAAGTGAETVPEQAEADNYCCYPS